MRNSKNDLEKENHIMSSKSLSSLIAGLAFGVCLISASPARGSGIPVFDAANLTQTTLSAFEAVTQTIKQIEEYALQLQQFEDQIKNSLAPAAYVWDQAQRTMNKIIGLQDQLDYYMSMYGSTDSYMKKFGSVSQYKSSPYFAPGGDKEAQRKELMEAEEVGSESQKHANDNVTKTLEQQQKALKEDATSLERLQQNAQSSQGRMEAIQSANQLASHQANQLLQLRALLTAQMAAENARAQTIAAREARQRAIAEKHAQESSYVKSPLRVW